MYLLHRDIEAFQVLILQISKNRRILPEIIEKDYYVTLMLQEIAKIQNEYDVFFKGGTALYKALKSIHRFSEDIDLTFNDTKFPTRTSKKTALKRVTSQYNCLEKDPLALGNISGSGSRTTVYTYKTMFAIDEFKDDTLDRIEKVKVETTSFTTSSPTASYVIEPILFTYASIEQQLMLKTYYNVKPFKMCCISMERIFIDKLFAIEDYYLGTDANRLIEVSKHMYDVFQLYNTDAVEVLLKNHGSILEIIEIKIEEQNRRIGAMTHNKKVHEFEYFNNLDNETIHQNFHSMLRIYVFKEEHFIDCEDVIETFQRILKIFIDFNL
ncbi:MAG: nucleotidyl transferase AbiEii/AbiGii toxin family protein [Erysipelothrix sp.]|nr:nucleotidyl transferase AbiEii/AbiGii toxin family protein [Erysipelothrix sp.]